MPSSFYNDTKGRWSHYSILKTQECWVQSKLEDESQLWSQCAMYTQAKWSLSGLLRRPWAKYTWHAVLELTLHFNRFDIFPFRWINCVSHHTHFCKLYNFAWKQTQEDGVRVIPTYKKQVHVATKAPAWLMVSQNNGMSCNNDGAFKA